MQTPKAVGTQKTEMTFHAKVRDVLAAEGWNLKNTHEEEQYSR